MSKMKQSYGTTTEPMFKFNTPFTYSQKLQYGFDSITKTNPSCSLQISNTRGASLGVNALKIQQPISSYSKQQLLIKNTSIKKQVSTRSRRSTKKSMSKDFEKASKNIIKNVYSSFRNFCYLHIKQKHLAHILKGEYYHFKFTYQEMKYNYFCAKNIDRSKQPLRHQFWQLMYEVKDKCKNYNKQLIQTMACTIIVREVFLFWLKYVAEYWMFRNSNVYFGKQYCLAGIKIIRESLIHDCKIVFSRQKMDDQKEFNPQIPFHFSSESQQQQQLCLLSIFSKQDTKNTKVQQNENVILNQIEQVQNQQASQQLLIFLNQNTIKEEQILMDFLDEYSIDYNYKMKCNQLREDKLIKEYEIESILYEINGWSGKL